MQKRFEVISPVDGSVYLTRPWASALEIEQALQAADAARSDWRRTPLSKRIQYGEAALHHFLKHTDRLAEEITRQMGRPLRYAPFEITKGFKERVQYMMDIAERSLADIEIERSNNWHRLIRQEPLGTVLVLAPWNYPFLTSVNVIIPALLAGNTVILKHAEQTPLAAEQYAAAFAAADLPAGVFQFLHMTHQQVGQVVQDPRIHHVAFTGSVNGGEAVRQSIGKRFISTGFELGGKDPAYVRADAALETTVENLVDGSFFNSGQSCCGIERIYVHESLYPSFVEQFVALTKAYVLGNPLDMDTTLGPLVRADAAVFAEGQIQEAVFQGAQPLIDTAHFPAHQSGTPYMAPQVLVDVHHGMRVMQEESFAPVVGIMPVQNDMEAIRLMNDSRYGLTASIWSADAESALSLGEQLQTGTVYLNRCDYLDPALAWTGVKQSGQGYTLSRLGYSALTQAKSYHLKLPSS